MIFTCCIYDVYLKKTAIAFNEFTLIGCGYTQSLFFCSDYMFFYLSKSHIVWDH